MTYPDPDDLRIGDEHSRLRLTALQRRLDNLRSASQSVPQEDPLRDAPPSFRRNRRDEGAAIRLSGRWHLLGRVMMRVTASIKEVAKRLGRRPQIVC